MIDLHTHSTASDGTLSPEDLIAAADAAGLSAVALTDHDTVDGNIAAEIAAKSAHLAFVPGIEISAAIERGALHIVGLHIDAKCERLRKTLETLVAARDSRNLEIVRKLIKLGYDLSIEDVAEIAGGGVVGRPHFAELLIRKGYVANSDEAFSRFLGQGKAAHVPKSRLEEREAIELIRNAGGVPILAHPTETLLDGQKLERLVARLAGYGLAGIEVYCSGYTPGKTRTYGRLAKKYNLVRSGGSDFHGEHKPGIKLGRGPGRLFVPDELLVPLAERAEIIRAASRL